MNSLLNFWSKAPLDIDPYVHPEDTLPPDNVCPRVADYEQYRSRFESESIPDTALHLGLLPQPYFGDLENAEILILLANPGFSVCDYHAETNYSNYRESIVRSIRQERRDHMFLDPIWAWTSGFEWWEGKLRSVARIIASERFDGHYGRALSDLSRRVVSLELVPYHSRNSGAVKGLRSTEEVRSFVGHIDSSRTIVVTRKVSDWGLPDAANIVRYPTSLARSSSLGAKSPGGRAILRHYGISTD